MKEFKANLPSCHELSNALRLALHKFLMTKKRPILCYIVFKEENSAVAIHVGFEEFKPKNLPSCRELSYMLL